MCACLLALVAVRPAAALAELTIRQQEWPLSYFDADQVWRHGSGQGVTVGVVDSGVDAHHADLVGQVVAGASFGGAGPDGTTDHDGHGTAMASIIAGTGRGDDGDGVKGLAFHARVLAVAVSASNDGTLASYAKGIRYAADHGARVINVSGGGPGDALALQEAIDYAIQHDIVVVAAAGNKGDASDEVDYPAGYPGVVAAAGVDSHGQPWKVSEHGPQIVLAAPGTRQSSAFRDGGYALIDGTSASCAWISATAAILRGLHPNWTAGDTIRQLITTARKPAGAPGGRDDHYGFGVVDPLAAVTTPLAPGPAGNPLLPHTAAPEPALTPPGFQVGISPRVVPTLVTAFVGGLLVLVLAAAVLGAVLLRRRHMRAGRRQPSWPGRPPPGAWPPPASPAPPPPPTWPPGPRPGPWPPDPAPPWPPPSPPPAPPPAWPPPPGQAGWGRER